MWAVVRGLTGGEVTGNPPAVRLQEVSVRRGKIHLAALTWGNQLPAWTACLISQSVAVDRVVATGRRPIRRFYEQPTAQIDCKRCLAILKTKCQFCDRELGPGGRVDVKAAYGFEYSICAVALNCQAHQRKRHAEAEEAQVRYEKQYRLSGLCVPHEDKIVSKE